QVLEGDRRPPHQRVPVEPDVAPWRAFEVVLRQKDQHDHPERGGHQRDDEDDADLLGRSELPVDLLYPSKLHRSPILPPKPPRIEISFVPGVAALPAAAWDALVDPDDP